MTGGHSKHDAGDGGHVAWVRDRDDTLRAVPVPEPLGDALRERVASRQGWRQRLRGASVFSGWETIVGEELAARCEPVRLAAGRLVVRAPSQAWATQVRYLGAEIVRQAAEVLGPGLVDTVDVVVGPLAGVAENRGDHGSDK